MVEQVERRAGVGICCNRLSTNLGAVEFDACHNKLAVKRTQN